MGRDKALLPFRGTTLVEWIAGQAREAAGIVVLVGAPERYADLGIPCLPERHGGCGPLSGIEAALREEGPDRRLILACDMPGVDADFLRGLLAAGSGSEADVVAATHPDGRVEPLCAVYRRRVHGPVEEALRRGDYAVRLLFGGHLSIAHYPVDSESLTRNINTVEEWAAWGS